MWLIHQGASTSGGPSPTVAQATRPPGTWQKRTSWPMDRVYVGQCQAAGPRGQRTRTAPRQSPALDAVGLTAAIRTALADAGLSCNVIAGYHHDHLLVPADRAPEAITVLPDHSGFRSRRFGLR